MLKTVKLSDVSEIIRGPGTGRESTSGKIVKFIRVSNLTNLITIDTTNLLIRKLSAKSFQPHSPMRIKKNDILISLTGTIGKTSIATKDLDCYPNSNLAIIRPREIRPEYLLCALNSKKFQQKLKKLARGVTVLHVPLASFKVDMEISIPSDSEQLKVVKKFNSLKNNIMDLELDLQKAKSELENFEIE